MRELKKKFQNSKMRECSNVRIVTTQVSREGKTCHFERFSIYVPVRNLVKQIVNGISPLKTNEELVEMTKLEHLWYLSSYKICDFGAVMRTGRTNAEQ